MNTLRSVHALATRCFHWVNAAALFMMIWSGLLIYWANPVYRVGLGDYTLLALFPEPFFQALGVPYRLAEGMSLHFFFMWFFAVNGMLYVAYTAWSGDWRELLPNRQSLSEAVQVTRRAFGLRARDLPRRKFNGAQQIAYTAVILMGAGSLLTGLAIYKPVQLAWLTGLLGGYEWVRWEHFWLAAGYVLFFIVHIVEVVRAGWNTIRGMVTGYEVVPVLDSAGPSSSPTKVTS